MSTTQDYNKSYKEIMTEKEEEMVEELRLKEENACDSIDFIFMHATCQQDE